MFAYSLGAHALFNLADNFTQRREILHGNTTIFLALLSFLALNATLSHQVIGNQEREHDLHVFYTTHTQFETAVPCGGRAEYEDDPTLEEEVMARILILGGGFASLAAVEVLSKSLSDEDEIKLISINSEFIFSPALVPMVFGDFRPEEIHFNIRAVLKNRNVGFIEGEVTNIDPSNGTVRLVSDSVEEIISFDYLLIALGRSLAVKEIPGLLAHSHQLLSPAAALKFRNAVAAFESGSIVVGLCPDALLPVPVCEAALGLARKFERKIADGTITVTAVFPSTLENAMAGTALFRDLESEFERKRIDVVSDFPVDYVDQNIILSKFGATLSHDLLMLVPPFHGLKQQNLSSFADRDGFLPVNEFMQVDGFDRIYAAGDIVALPGPKFGYMAIRQGKVAANNIIAQLRTQRPASEYSHDLAWLMGEKYTDPVFFHYGFWDETLADFDEDAFFGMARQIRKRYGKVDSRAAKMPLSD